MIRKLILKIWGKFIFQNNFTYLKKDFPIKKKDLKFSFTLTLLFNFFNHDY